MARESMSPREARLEAEMYGAFIRWFKHSPAASKGTRIVLSLAVGFFFVLAVSIAGTILGVVIGFNPFDNTFMAFLQGMVVMALWIIYPVIVFRRGRTGFLKRLLDDKR